MYDVVARPTFPGTVHGWMLDRFRALVTALEIDGLPFARALPLARAVLALWQQETNIGRAEDNFNGGNLHTGSGTPDVGRGWDGDADAWFRAYRTPLDAAIDSVELLRSARYRDAWNDLVRGPDNAARWYEAVVNAGYHPYTANSVWDFINLYEGTPRRFTQTEG